LERRVKALPLLVAHRLKITQFNGDCELSEKRMVIAMDRNENPG
jgi:hypothetical protein